MAQSGLNPVRQRASVAMIVLNAVRHDTRVLKEARALAEAGHRVTIIGVAERRQACSLPGGITLRTVSLISATRLALVWVPRVVAGLSLLVMLALLRPAWWVTALVLLPAIGLVGPLRRLLLRGVPGASRVLQWPLLKQAGQAFWNLKHRIWLAVRCRQILAELRAVRPAIIHCHDANTLPIGHAYRRRYGGLLVYDSHELAEHQQAVEGSAGRIVKMQARLSGAVAGFITVNDHIAAYMNRHYPRLPAATVVRNATPLPASWEADDRLRRAAGLPAGMKILLFQGGFAPGRGLRTLVQAVPRLPADWAVVLMGWGSLEATLRQDAEKLPRRREALRFLPGVPESELRQWTAGATVGVIPYENTCLNHWFCSPNKLWEYPCAGVPILASDFPVMRDVIQGHGIGWLLPDPLDPRTLAEVVASLTDADLAAARANCRRFLEQDNWSIYARRLLELYERLDAPTHRPAAELQAA